MFCMSCITLFLMRVTRNIPFFFPSTWQCTWIKRNSGSSKFKLQSEKRWFTAGHRVKVGVTCERLSYIFIQEEGVSRHEEQFVMTMKMNTALKTQFDEGENYSPVFNFMTSTKWNPKNDVWNVKTTCCRMRRSQENTRLILFHALWILLSYLY